VVIYIMIHRKKEKVWNQESWNSSCNA